MVTKPASTMFIPHVPEDPDILAGWGKIAYRHAMLDNILRMTIKTLTRVKTAEALDATARVQSSTLRQRIRKIARSELGEGAALIRLEALLTRAGRATDKRNELMHNIIGQPLDGEPLEPLMRGSDHTWGPLPTVADLLELEIEILTVTDELNTARLHGFIAEALGTKGKRG